MPSAYPASPVPLSNEGWTHPELNFLPRVSGRHYIVSWIVQRFHGDEPVYCEQTALRESLACTAKPDPVETGNGSLRKVEEETPVMRMLR